MNVFVIIVITLAVHAVLLALASLITPMYVRLVACTVAFYALTGSINPARLRAT